MNCLARTGRATGYEGRLREAIRGRARSCRMPLRTARMRRKMGDIMRNRNARGSECAAPQDDGGCTLVFLSVDTLFGVWLREKRVLSGITWDVP